MISDILPAFEELEHLVSLEKTHDHILEFSVKYVWRPILDFKDYSPSDTVTLGKLCAANLLDLLMYANAYNRESTCWILIVNI